jgi:hypothetical protein
MNEETTGTLNDSTKTRMGHILAHVHNRKEIFNLLGTAVDNAVQDIHKVRGISQEMDTQEINLIYEDVSEYHFHYPKKGSTPTESAFRWTLILETLLRDAATHYTYMAARCDELDEALEYAAFAVDLWDILAELKRELATEQLRDQISQVIDSV